MFAAHFRLFVLVAIDLGDEAARESGNTRRAAVAEEANEQPLVASDHVHHRSGTGHTDSADADARRRTGRVHHVVQFANISRPGVRPQLAKGRKRELVRTLTRHPNHLKEMPGEDR